MRSDAGHIGRGRPVLLAILLAVITTVCYAGSFGGVFLFDDTKHIVDAERIRQLWPPAEVLSGRRPVVDLSLAVNYAISGPNVWSYHAFNLAFHLLAALTLFGVVRRTLPRVASAATSAAQSDWLAFVTALIWAVHPLQTQSVTYIIQRGESLMGLFYLLTLYCLIRGADSLRSGWWYAGAVAACALGMGSKAVMVTAPLMILLYDRFFLARSFAVAVKTRWGLYAGLAATWMILGLCGVAQGVLSPSHRVATVGLSYKGITPIEYALTQAGVLVHYLRLSIWPYPLCLDYDWPAAQTAGPVFTAAVLIVALLVAVAWAFRRCIWLAFVGVWFFLILAPTSSLIPIKDVLFEHRMYLSLAAVAVVVVAAGHALLSWLARATSSGALGTGAAQPAFGRSWLAVAVVVLLACGTARRNSDYRDKAVMWGDVIAKRPHNARGHYNLGCALEEAGTLDAVMVAYREALRIRPSYAEAHNNLGNALRERGDVDEAMEHYREALRQKPHYPEAHNNMGNALKEQESYDEALRHYREALRQRPDFAEVHSNIGNMLVAQGRFDEGIEEYRKALRLQPDYADAHINMGVAWEKQGNREEADKAFRNALRVSPEYPEAHNSLGNALAAQGRLDEAVEEFRRALRFDPGYAEARANLGNALLEQGKLDSAIQAYRETLEVRPAYPEVHSNLCLALFRQNRLDEAVQACYQAMHLKPLYPEAHYNLANALLAQGDLDSAIAEYREALNERAEYPEARSNLGIALGRSGKLAEAAAEFRTALRLRPDYAEAHSNLGNALAGLGRPDEAIEAYRAAVTFKPDFVEAYYNLGRALAGRGRFEEAAQAFRAVLRLQPDHAAARQGLEDALASVRRGNGE